MPLSLQILIYITFAASSYAFWDLYIPKDTMDPFFVHYILHLFLLPYDNTKNTTAFTEAVHGEGQYQFTAPRLCSTHNRVTAVLRYRPEQTP